MVGLLMGSAEFQDGRIGLGLEVAHVGSMLGQEADDVRCRTVPEAKPYDFGWRTVEQTQSMEVGIFCNEYATVFAR